MLSKTPAKLVPPVPPEAPSSTQLEIVPREGEDKQAAATRLLVGPLASARIALEISSKQAGESLHLAPFAAALARAATLVNSGDMNDVEATLVNQATALNVMFGELGSLAISNMGTNSEASERYLRMALKAQKPISDDTGNSEQHEEPFGDLCQANQYRSWATASEQRHYATHHA